MPDLNRIDFDKGVFMSNGNKYYIAPLEMPYKRLVRFTQMQSEITTGVKLQDAAQFIYEMYLTMKKGEDGNFKEAFLDAFEQIANFTKAMEGFNPEKLAEQNYDRYLEFATLFILREDEDYSQYDPRIAEDKINDWKKDMYVKDFFFAVFYQLNLSTKQSEDFTKTISQV
jgi:hypothetical protein